FDEVLAQEHVTRTLQNALRAGRIGHAYLFCGPRGTGKTSTARILAKAVNCLAEPTARPCNCCARCEAINAGRDLDLIEIDAASNRGIDEIRDLRDKVAFSPNEGRYKVYVIDEVHMLTNEAFNALLKTLEEPPPHVIFVLATTEPQRIPPTILSRCQRFDFRRIPLADLRRKLEHICQTEQIAIEPAAIEAIARRAGGSFRDAESLLDQLVAAGEGEISLQRVQELLGGVSLAAVADLVDAWLDADLAAGLREINRLVDAGADARQLQLELVEYLRGLLLLQAGGDDRLANITAEAAGRMREQLARLTLPRLVDALRIFSQSEGAARGEVRSQMPLELAFVQAVLAANPQEEARQLAIPALKPETAAPAGTRRAPTPEGGRPAAALGASRRAESPARAAAPEPAVAAPAASAPEPGAEVTLARLTRQWPEILQRLRGTSKVLEALMRSGRPCELAGGKVVFEMEAAFHQERVMEEKNRRILEQVLQEFVGVPCQVECIVAGRRTTRGARGPAVDEAVREDPVVRYAVEDLGARVQSVQRAEPEASDDK
ncbi:MAG: DNA polymerase III subunit gamma/tau, partial [Anaerolineae bacterium]|nr:DNA polymerase III subunit gamma/tau [Anaerolineae bacterium]